MKESPERVEAFRKMVEAAGGTTLLLVYTMGPHDLVVAVDLPRMKSRMSSLCGTARKETPAR